MANENTMCASALMEMMLTTHAIGTPAHSHTASGAKDTIKAALYLASGSVGYATTAYATASEVSGSGYTAGGITATNANAPAVTNKTAYWTPSASLVYTAVTLSTSFDAVLLYNATMSNKAISVHSFGAQTVTAGTFTLTMPVNSEGAALIRMTVLP